jgi:cytochrome c oxidase subunit 4
MNSTSARKRTYVRVWLALLLLLFLTWGLAEINLGAFNTIAAIGISVGKMLLVVLVFMHGRYEKALTWLFISGGVIWFVIMVDLTLSDYMTRGDKSSTANSWRHVEKNPPSLQPGVGMKRK